MKDLTILEVNENDKKWIIQLMEDQWASTRVITRGNVHNTEELPGLIAVQNNMRLGLLIYNIKDFDCEIVSLNSLVKRKGIGSALIQRVIKIATKRSCKRIWVITTNDNTEALRFYQMRGFKIKAVYIDAVKKSRQLKPELPLLGIDNIEIRDEIELEKELK
ncbi:MAG: GNAT family N-acetyltransferase [Promethearchaeota archaeon]